MKHPIKSFKDNFVQKINNIYVVAAQAENFFSDSLDPQTEKEGVHTRQCNYRTL